MPRYFFDITDGEIFVDDTGTELDDLTAARTAAINILPEIASECFKVECSKVAEAVVRADDGKPLFRATLTFKCDVLE